MCNRHPEDNENEIANTQETSNWQLLILYVLSLSVFLFSIVLLCS